jgi:hypothetical protein
VTAKKTKKAAKVEAPQEVVVAYKGFDMALVCNPTGDKPFQYKIGESYSVKGDITCCGNGLHSCEMPLDVLTYYKLNTSRFALVEAGGAISRKDGGDSKLASAKLTITAELKFGELITRAVAWILERAKGNTATGNYGHAAATGDSGHAAATGDSGHAAATGDSGHAAATGNYGHAAATGNSGHAAATGNYGHAAATGDSGHAAATGDSGHAAATGDSGHAAATGDSGHAAATGNYGHAAATGYYGHAAATGYYGHAAATGNSGCAFAGFGGRAKAADKGAFAIAWFDQAAKRARLIVGTPGENGIKPDTFYLVNKQGELEEATK